MLSWVMPKYFSSRSLQNFMGYTKSNAPYNDNASGGWTNGHTEAKVSLGAVEVLHPYLCILA